MTLFSTIPAPLTRFILGELYLALPGLAEEPEDTREIRKLAAMAAIARLTPMNTGEAMLAVQAVASEMHATGALQEAVLHRGDIRVVAQCRAQSAMMTRQAMQIRKELRIVQEARRGAEDWQAAKDRAEAAEREAAEPDAPACDAPEAPERAPPTLPEAPPRRFARHWLQEKAQQKSHATGQNPMSYSVETHLDPPRLPDPNDKGVAALAAFALASARRANPPHGQAEWAESRGMPVQVTAS